MLGFLGIRESGYLAHARIVDEAVGAAGEHLVGVALVGGVEDDAVARRVEDAVQGDRGLDDAEVRPEVAAGGAHALDDGGAALRGELVELVERERIQVARTRDALQKIECHALPHARRQYLRASVTHFPHGAVRGCRFLDNEQSNDGVQAQLWRYSTGSPEKLMPPVSVRASTGMNGPSRKQRSASITESCARS